MLPNVALSVLAPVASVVHPAGAAAVAAVTWTPVVAGELATADAARELAADVKRPPDAGPTAPPALALEKSERPANGFAEAGAAEPASVDADVEAEAGALEPSRKELVLLLGKAVLCKLPPVAEACAKTLPAVVDVAEEPKSEALGCANGFTAVADAAAELKRAPGAGDGLESEMPAKGFELPPEGALPLPPTGAADVLLAAAPNETPAEEDPDSREIPAKGLEAEVLLVAAPKEPPDEPDGGSSEIPANGLLVEELGVKRPDDAAGPSGAAAPRRSASPSGGPSAGRFSDIAASVSDT